jgi:hypothetical protein
VVSCAPLFAEVMHMVQHNNSISGKFLMWPSVMKQSSGLF